MKFTHESSLRLLIYTNIFPNKFLFAKQRGRAQWGNISSELARTIIARGVEATARSHHNVTGRQSTLNPLTSGEICNCRCTASCIGSELIGRLFSIASIRVDKISEYAESNVILPQYWVRLSVVYSGSSAEAIVDASDAKLLTLTLHQLFSYDGLTALFCRFWISNSKVDFDLV